MAQISTHIHSQCARVMHKIQKWQSVTPINPTALLALITDVWATNGSLWTRLEPAPSEGKMSHRLSAQLSTGIPQVAILIFHLVTGCSRRCYLQGVQAGQFLALLCLLAVQGGQELPSHPEIKERVKSFVHWWENVLKRKQAVHQNVTWVHLVLILHRGTDSACGSMGIMAQSLSHHANEVFFCPSPPLQAQCAPHHITEWKHNLCECIHLFECTASNFQHFTESPRLQETFKIS